VQLDTNRREVNDVKMYGNNPINQRSWWFKIRQCYLELRWSAPESRWSFAYRLYDRPSLKKAWTGHVIHFKILHPLINFSGMAEDRIVEFCARIDARTFSLVMMTNCTPGGRD